MKAYSLLLHFASGCLGKLIDEIDVRWHGELKGSKIFNFRDEVSLWSFYQAGLTLLILVSQWDRRTSLSTFPFRPSFKTTKAWPTSPHRS